MPGGRSDQPGWGTIRKLRRHFVKLKYLGAVIRLSPGRHPLPTGPLVADVQPCPTLSTIAGPIRRHPGSVALRRATGAEDLFTDLDAADR